MLNRNFTATLLNCIAVIQILLLPPIRFFMLGRGFFEPVFREEIVTLAKNIEAAGASIINTGIGWHEARIPTIATSVPRAGFSWVTKKLKGQVRHVG